MNTRFILLAVMGSILGACNSTPTQNSAKSRKDSIAAKNHFDSLRNLSKQMQQQDSIDATAKKDTGKKL